MAVTCNAYSSPTPAVLSASTVTALTIGSGVRAVWVYCSANIYLVYGTADGAAVPAGVWLIPAGSLWPIEVAGPLPSVAATTGTPTAYFLPVM